MRVATWNINGVRGRLGPLLRWLDDRKPDLVALQKIKVPEQDFPKDRFHDAGYYAVAHCYPKSHLDGDDHGVAILTRTPPQRVETELDGQQHLGARLLTVAVDGLEFSSVYAPWGKREGIDAKLRWFDSLIAYLRETHSPSEQRVLCGDFNVVSDCRVRAEEPPKNPLNCGDPVREKFRALLEVGGLSDLYARRPPDWEDPFKFKGPQGSLKFSRLEYALGTHPIVDRARVVEFDIDHAIVNNGFFPWVRAPIVAVLDD